MSTNSDYTVPNQHDVFNLLKNKRKLHHSDNFKHVSIYTDRTLLQRKHLRSILDELNSIKSAGEIDLYYIKDVNNVPIVSKNCVYHVKNQKI